MHGAQVGTGISMVWPKTIGSSTSEEYVCLYSCECPICMYIHVPVTYCLSTFFLLRFYFCYVQLQSTLLSVVQLIKFSVLPHPFSLCCVCGILVLISLISLLPLHPC